MHVLEQAAAFRPAVLAVIERDGVLERVEQVGAKLTDAIVGLAHPQIAGMRGRGMLQGISLNAPISPRACVLGQDAGFILNPVREDTIRLAPSLLLESEHIDEFVAALPGLLDAAAEENAAAADGR